MPLSSFPQVMHTDKKPRKSIDTKPLSSYHKSGTWIKKVLKTKNENKLKQRLLAGRCFILPLSLLIKNDSHMVSRLWWSCGELHPGPVGYPLPFYKHSLLKFYATVTLEDRRNITAAPQVKGRPYALLLRKALVRSSMTPAVSIWRQWADACQWLDKWCGLKGRYLNRLKQASCATEDAGYCLANASKWFCTY